MNKRQTGRALVGGGALLAGAMGAGCSRCDWAQRPGWADGGSSPFAPFIISVAACSDGRPEARAYANDPAGFISAKEAEIRR